MNKKLKREQCKEVNEAEEMAGIINQLPRDEKLTLKGVLTGLSLATQKKTAPEKENGDETDGG